MQPDEQADSAEAHSSVSHPPLSAASHRPPTTVAQQAQPHTLPSNTAIVNATGDTIPPREDIADKLHDAATTATADMSVQPAYRRTQSHRPPRSTADSTEPSSSRRSQASSELQDRERQRLKAAAAAKLAERENWEKTRGAGSAVLDLLRPTDESDSADSGGERATTPGSGNSQLSTGADNSGSGSASGSASGSGRSQPKARPKKVKPARTHWEANQVLPALEDVQNRKSAPVMVSSADKLLTRGISEYTILPKILGRGKFSSVFLASKPHGPTGEPQLFAVKHTPLFPHHPLIATRLLREPTLLAELPPHPNLVNVYETIRTPGHFYLVEEYLGDYVTLEALMPLRTEQSPPNLPILPTGVANFVLDQMLAAVNAIHNPLQICHRDIKPENILVHPDTLQLKLLDFGLATHYSRSEPKLSTCCGSPAFHCPEIVTALRNPLGTVRYWGPEVDAWTCGITMLRLLTGVRYPIGASHSSVRSMSIKAQRAVATIKDPELRERISMLLEINGEKRMRNFDDLVRAVEQNQEEPQRGLKDFKSTSFVPTTPEHTMNLPLVVGPAAEAALISPLLPSGATPSGSRRSTPLGSRASSPARGGLQHVDVSDADVSPAPTLLLSNPTGQPPQRVLSYIKYCLRSAGILYHCWPDTSSSSSVPSTPGLFDQAFHDFNSADPTSAKSSDPTTSSGSDVTPPPDISPSTPFPMQASRSERDPYSHIHIFECVLTIPDEPEPVTEQPTLVQSIFSALSFGRRPANRRSSSTPPGTDGLNGSAKPAATQADDPAASSGAPGDVRCLTFYLVLRFPRKTSGNVSFVQSRPSYSRSSSVVGRSQPNRSRASSTAALDADRLGPQRVASSDNLTLLTKLNSGHAEFATGIHPMKKAMIDSNHTTPRASRTASPSVAYNTLKKREGSLAGSRERRGRHLNEALAARGGNDLALTIETSPELLKLAQAQAQADDSLRPSSAPSSRATSRARSRKASRARAASTSHGRGSNKVFVHVTERRALDAIKKALSIGGTTTDFNPDSESEQDNHAGWLTPSVHSKEFNFGPDSITSNGADKTQRPRMRRRPISVGGKPTDAETTPTSESSRPAWPENVGSSGPSSDDGEQYTRGRTLRPAGAPVASGIPFPANMHRLRAPSNLSFAVVQEESSPSNTDQSASQSKTMLDPPSARGKSSGMPATPQSPSFDLKGTLSLLSTHIAQALEAENVDKQFLVETEDQVSSIATHLASLSKDSLREELDALSFDIFKSLSPLLGLTNEDASPTHTASMAKRVLTLLADNASSRELYMAIDLRCSEMLNLTQRWTEVQIGSVLWLKMAETVQLLYLLNTVLPKVRTKQPQQFSSAFIGVPQCLALGLRSTAEISVPVSEKLARAAIEACCSSVLIVVDWETSCLDDSVKRGPTRQTSREALERFFAGVTSCLPYLAGAQTSLSESFFLANSPRYAVTSSTERQSVVKLNESTFAEVSRTLASLQVDLANMWQSCLQAVTPEDAAAQTMLLALGSNGFVLDTYLVCSGYASDRPREWSDEHARTQLEATMPAVLLALAKQTTAAASPDLEEGKENMLSDTTLLRLQWCFGALTEATPLAAELTTSLAQTLATQSVISPSPVARLMRFKLLTELLVHKSESKLALQIVGELATQSPFAQMKAGAISILRSITVAKTWTKADSELIALLDTLFALPAQTDEEGMANTLAETADKLTETLSLLLALKSQTEIDTKRYEDEFVQPLVTMLSKLEQKEVSSEQRQSLDLLRIATDRVL